MSDCLDPLELAGRFARLAFGEETGPRQELGEQLRGLVASARGAWPGLCLSALDFVDHLAGLTVRAKSADWGRVLAEVAPHAPDLYLACACSRGDGAALAAFDRDHLQAVPALVARYAPSQDFAAEVQQALRIKLLLPGAEGGASRMAGYSGSAPLRVWLQVIVKRTASDVWSQRGGQGAVALEERDEQRPGVGDPEQELLWTHHGGQVKQTLKEALAALPSRERAVLQMIGQGMTGAAIAARLGVDRSTVVRSRKSALAAVEDQARRRLSEQLRLDTEQLDSLLRLVISHLDLSLPQIQEDGEEGDGVQKVRK